MPYFVDIKYLEFPNLKEYMLGTMLKKKKKKKNPWQELYVSYWVFKLANIWNGVTNYFFFTMNAFLIYVLLIAWVLSVDVEQIIKLSFIQDMPQFTISWYSENLKISFDSIC